jgi:nitrate reductase NapAB chaperone NapD
MPKSIREDCNMTAANMSGVILVTCDGKQCQNIIKETKSKIPGITSACIVDKERDDAPDVIINMDAASREDIREATQIVVNMDGV